MRSGAESSFEMYATQPLTTGSTCHTPHATFTPGPHLERPSEELLQLVLEPETERSRSYWMSMVGCLMISVSCLAIFVMAAARR